MDKQTTLWAKWLNEDIDPENKTDKPFNLKEDIRTVYQALVQRGLQVRIIRIYGNERPEVLLQDVSDKDEEVYHLEVINLQHSDITHREWSKLLASMGGKILPS